jgi:glycosyltransferase involved in cell wall biosynthesis
MVGHADESERAQVDDRWLADALRKLASHATSSYPVADESATMRPPTPRDAAAEREPVVELLQHLLTPAVCRRLGIYPWPEDFLLSVVVPAYNEAATIETILERVRSVGVPCEIIVADDASTDGTGAILDRLAEQDSIRVIHLPRNRGKGAAIRAALAHVGGQVVLIQDADLEYDPHDYPLLLRPILEDRADVVYGSRFSANDRPVAKYWHQTANRLVTWLSNLCTNLKLSDVETGYKVVRRELIDQIRPSLREDGFGIELELTARLARIPGIRFYELPISYSPRGYAEGKKIGWRDALRALWCVVRYRWAS